MLCSLIVDDNGLFNVDVFSIFFVEIVPGIGIGAVEASVLVSVGSVTVDLFKAFVVEKSECIVINVDWGIMLNVLSNIVVIEYENLVAGWAALLVLDDVGALIVDENEVFALAVDRTFVVERGTGAVIATDEASCLDFVESITDDFFEAVGDEGIATDVNGTFTVDEVWNIACDEYRGFVVSIAGVPVLYLLCDFNVDKVDRILSSFVETVASFVIGVVENSGMDLVGCITVEISIVFIVEKIEFIVKDVNWVFMVDEVWNKAVVKYGSFVVSFARLLVLDVVDSLIFVEVEVLTVAVDLVFVFEACQDTDIGTDEASCLDLLEGITDDIFKVFIGDADEGIATDVIGMFTVNVVWNIAPDEYKGFVLSVVGVSALYLLRSLTVDKNGPFVVDVIWTFFLDSPPGVATGVAEALGLDSFRSVTDIFIDFVVEESERIVTEVNWAFIVYELWNMAANEYGSLFVMDSVGRLTVDRNDVFAVTVGETFVVEAGLGSVIVTVSGLVVDGGIFVELVEIFVLDESKGIAIDASETLNAAFVLDKLVNVYWAFVAITTDLLVL